MPEYFNQINSKLLRYFILLKTFLFNIHFSPANFFKFFLHFSVAANNVILPQNNYGN